MESWSTMVRVLIDLIGQLDVGYLCLCLILFPLLAVLAADAVVRNVYYKYFHPKEALVSNGVLNRLMSALHTSSGRAFGTH